MALPKQIEQQVAEVEAIEKAMAEHAAQAVQTESQNVPDEPPVAAEEASSVEATPSNVTELKPQQARVEEPWEQRYHTLKGMFDSQVPSLHAQVKELNQKLQDALAAMAQAKEAKPAEKTTVVTSADEEAFGTDLIDLQRRIAAEVLTPVREELGKLHAENAKLREQLGRTGTEVAVVSFEQKLLSTVPDFIEVNTNPAWVAWLDEVDPLSLEPRRAQAENAYNAGNVAKVAHFVNLFKQAQNPSASKQVQETKQAEIQSQVAPSRTTATAPANVQGAKFYTEADANKLWDKIRVLNGQGKYDDAAKIESELTAAYTQGRIR